MKEIDIKLSSVDVRVKTRKLRASWNPTMINDLSVDLSVDWAADFYRGYRADCRKESINNIFKNVKHDS